MQKIVCKISDIFEEMMSFKTQVSLCYRVPVIEKCLDLCLLPSFLFCAKDALTIAIVSAKFSGLVRLND